MQASATRHQALALRALACGHGVQWAADITVPAARSVPDVPCGPSLWEALVLTLGRLYPRRGGGS